MNGDATARPMIWLLLPLVFVVGIVSALLLTQPLDRLTSAAPPVEDLKVESMRLTPDLMSFDVRADGSGPLQIAQVQVDAAYRQFTITPPGPISRLGQARVDIPYPWVAGEAHKVVFLTRTGAAFTHEIPVAQETPGLAGENAALLIAVGLLLGVAPVTAGLFAYPAMRSLGTGSMQFILALTIGLLLYLLIDTLSEGLEIATKAIDRLHAKTLVWVAAAASAALLLAIGRSGGKRPEGVALATFIALGIGLHNLGEGLAVGASIASGAAALATFLVIGFTIHNVSEGFGIAAPLVGTRPRLLTFAALAALAGLPAVAGVLLGAQSVSPYWTALCFGVGAGAIAQVIIEITALMLARGGTQGVITTSTLAGIIAGLGVMYLTALFV